MFMGDKLRRLGKAGATAAFGSLVFVLVFFLTLPYARFKDFIAAQVSSYGYDMEAKYAGPSLGLGMTMKEISLVSRPSGVGKPTRILIDRAKIGLSLLSYLVGRKSIGISTDVFAGEIDADVNVGKNDSAVVGKVTEIDLGELPWVKSAINLPASGKLDVKLRLALPKQRLSESKGQLQWECHACALGDGKAKLVVVGNPLLAEGLGLPKIRLGDFSGKVVIDKGTGRLQNVQFKSQDLEATIEGEIHLAQPAATSHVDLYVRFKLSDSLLRSSEKLRTIMDFTAQMGKRPDGFIGFRMTGTFQNMGNVQWMKTSPFLSAPAPSKPLPHPVLPPPPPAVATAFKPPVPLPSAPPPAPAPEPTPPPPPPAPAPPPAPTTPPPAPQAAPQTAPTVPPPVPSTTPPPAPPVREDARHPPSEHAPSPPTLPAPAAPGPGAPPTSVVGTVPPAPGSAPAQPSTESEPK